MIISYKTIGRNIRAARKAMGLTQEQAAEKMKFSVLHYGRLERGERPASLEQLAQTAQLLNVSLPSLLSGCMEGVNFGAEASAPALTLGEQVANIANNCSPEAQTMMLALVKTVAEQDRITQFKK